MQGSVSLIRLIGRRGIAEPGSRILLGSERAYHRICILDPAPRLHSGLGSPSAFWARQSLFFRRGGSGLPIPTFCASPLLRASLRHNFVHIFFENTILPSYERVELQHLRVA